MNQSIASLFNAPSIPTEHTVPVRDRIDTLPDTAYLSTNPDYYFDLTLLKKLLRFFVKEPVRRNILLIGDTGAGKTSVIEQVAARLNWPVFDIAASGKLRLQHLVGSMQFVEGETRWVDGPLVAAMRVGGVFLIDEVTRMDHSEQMALAKVLDSGCRITIPDTGEMVAAHPDFRFCATGNSGGYGDESGAYNGEKVSSAAFLDRFQKYLIDYMPEEAEIDLLQNVVTRRFPGVNFPREIHQAMVRLANEVRKNFVNRGGDLRTILTTRSLVTWALEAVEYANLRVSKTPVEEALADTLLNGTPDHDASVIRELWGKWINASE